MPTKTANKGARVNMGKTPAISTARGLARASDVRKETARGMRPPLRRRVSEVAAEHYRVRTASGGLERWNPKVTPYMVEPIDRLTSRENEAVCFVGPARCGKSAALLGAIAYIVIGDPSDAMVVNMTLDKAGKFSKKELNRLFNDSPTLKEALSTRPHDNNSYSKVLRSGNVLYVAWPSASQLSAETLKYVFFTDFDRMPLNVNHEGSPFLLGKKRIQTFLSRGCVFLESSPGYEITDPDWKPQTLHEAPPTYGAFEVYNLGNRNRWYWQCPECKEHVMEPTDYSGFFFNHARDDKGYTIPSEMGPVYLICSKCGSLIDEKHKSAMLATGEWRPDPKAPKDTGFATYWLSGAAARYQQWGSIVQNYLKAERVYDTTGNEEPLRNVTNLDMGAAYLTRSRRAVLATDDLTGRVESDLSRGTVPEGVRFLLAAVDVQGGDKPRFEVQVIGYGVGLESWIIDRYQVRQHDGENINPAQFQEHWDALTDQVMTRVYPLNDGSGRAMRVLCTGCDMGGAAGVTDKAYNFYRNLRKASVNPKLCPMPQQRFRLTQGRRTAHGNFPRVKTAYQDITEQGRNPKGNKRQRHTVKASTGDIPVLQMNVTLLKDEVANDMLRSDPGPGFMHWGEWLKKVRGFFKELTAESRTAKGWEKRDPKARNETFDLYVIGRALCIALGAEAMDWDRPKPWAREWDENSEVIDPKSRKTRKSASEKGTDKPKIRDRVRFRMGQ